MASSTSFIVKPACSKSSQRPSNPPWRPTISISFGPISWPVPKSRTVSPRDNFVLIVGIVAPLVSSPGVLRPADVDKAAESIGREAFPRAPGGPLEPPGEPIVVLGLAERPGPMARSLISSSPSPTTRTPTETCGLRAADAWSCVSGPVPSNTADAPPPGEPWPPGPRARPAPSGPRASIGDRSAGRRSSCPRQLATRLRPVAAGPRPAYGRTHPKPIGPDPTMPRRRRGPPCPDSRQDGRSCGPAIQR